MRNILTATVIVAFLSGLTTACVGGNPESAETGQTAALPMKPGLWETKVTFTDIQVQGLSANKKQKLLEDISHQLSGKSCLSAQQARKPDANFFAGGQSDDCQYKKFEIVDGRLGMTVGCSMKSLATIDMDMDGAVAATALDLDIMPVLRLPMIGRVTLQGKAEGRYLGICDPKK